MTDLMSILAIMLAMLIGAFLGWRGALFALVAGAMQGLAVAVGAIVSGRAITPTPPDAHEPVEDGDPDEEAMPPGEEGDQQLFDGGVLTDDDPGDFGPEGGIGLGEFAGRLDVVLRRGGCGRHLW